MVSNEESYLLIGNTAESIIRILSLEVDHKLGKLMISAKEVDGVFQRLPSDDSGEIAVRLSMNRSLKSSLQISGPSFIQPAGEM